MATATLDRKTSRLDLRLTDEQKRRIETAASLSGISVSQWSISHLLESAQQAIADQSTLRMTEEAFDAFAALLDEPVEPDFASFLTEKTRWEA